MPQDFVHAMVFNQSGEMSEMMAKKCAILYPKQQSPCCIINGEFIAPHG